MSDGLLRWTRKGTAHCAKQAPERHALFGSPAPGDAVAPDALAEMISLGIAPFTGLKLGFYVGTPPEAPRAMLDALDSWQANLSWPTATPDEAPLLAELKELLAPELGGLACAAWPDVLGDVRLLRYLRGFEYFVPAALAAVHRALACRADYGLDAAHERACGTARAAGYDGAGFAHVERVRKFLPALWNAGASTEGHAVVHVSLGAHDRAGLWASGVSEEDYLAYYAEQSEARMGQLHDLSEARASMAKMIVVLSLKGVSLSMLSNKRFLQMEKAHLKRIDGANAESLAIMFLLHLPTFARFFYDSVKRVIPSSTAAKFVVVERGAEARTLLRAMDAPTVQRIMAFEAELHGDDDADGAMRIHAGRKASRTVLVEPGQTARWSWHVEARDVSFSVLLHAPAAERGSDGGGEREARVVHVAEERVVRASEGSVRGEWTAPPAVEADGDAPPPAMLELHWSNADSWLRSKTVAGLELSVV